MEFWGIEVKAGQAIKTNPGDNYVIHLSQASLGESKNKAESVPLYVNVNGKKLGLGTLSHQNCPQLSFDLVFEQDFELSHNWKNGSVFFLGYKSPLGEEEGTGFGDDFDMSSDEEISEGEEVPVTAAENGKAKAEAKTAKANAGKPDGGKKTVKIEEPSTNQEDDSDSDDESGSDDEDDSEDEDGSDESMDGSSEDEEEETPKKVQSSKKRPAEAATPVSAKKAKSAVTPQKTDGKKGGHTATPHPAKQGGKASAKSPKSGGQVSCGSCSKTFGSEGALESHKKAKHGGK